MLSIRRYIPIAQIVLFIRSMLWDRSHWVENCSFRYLLIMIMTKTERMRGTIVEAPKLVQDLFMNSKNSF